MGPLPTFFYSLMHCNAVNIYFQDTFQDLVNSQGLFQEISLAQSQQHLNIGEDFSAQILCLVRSS